MNKRYILLAVGLISFAALIFFYFRRPESNSDKIQINIIGENSSTIQALISLEKDYELKNPNIDLVFHPNTYDDAFNKSNQDFTNKTGLYDIVLQYNFSLTSFVGNKYVYPIDELLQQLPNVDKSFESDLFPNAWTEVGYFYKDINNQKSGTVKVGYPFAANSMLVMYNKEMLENEQNKTNFKIRYGKDLVPPDNWDDFYMIAEFFTNKSADTYGVCLEGGNGGFLYYDWSNFLYGMGGKIMDKNVGWHGDVNSTLYLTSPESIKALTFYKSLRPFNKGNFSDVEQSLQMKYMKEGKTALAIVWSDMLYPNLNTENGFDKRFGFKELPGGKSVLAGGAFFINKQSKHPLEAAKYIMSIMQEGNQVQLSRKGLSCPTMKAYSDPEVQKLPYAAPLYNSLKRGGVVLEAGPDANLISEVLTTYIQKCWNNELPPHIALEKAQAEIQEKRIEIFNSLRTNQSR
jgi:multiple sugar transport system substrate-binding protein